MATGPAQITDPERPLPLKEQAYRQLLALLMSGELTPESSWSERSLAARLGMSKTPIRVALERLDRDGFIEILPQSGVRLRELTEAAGFSSVVRHDPGEPSNVYYEVRP